MKQVTAKIHTLITTDCGLQQKKKPWHDVKQNYDLLLFFIYFPSQFHSASLHRIEVRDPDHRPQYRHHHSSTRRNAQQKVLQRRRNSRSRSLRNLRNHHRRRQSSGRNSSDSLLLQRRSDGDEPSVGLRSSSNGLARPRRRQWIEESVVGEWLLAGVGQWQGHWNCRSGSHWWWFGSCCCELGISGRLWELGIRDFGKWEGANEIEEVGIWGFLVSLKSSSMSDVATSLCLIGG